MDPKFITSLGGRDFVLYAGLLAEAHERGLQSIETQLVQIPAEENGNVAIAKAMVTMKDGSRFEEFGDASPRNVNTSPRVRLDQALPRMALTRAKGRALRDAVNVGQTMAEELADLEEERAASSPPRVQRSEPTREGSGAGGVLVCVADGCGVILTQGQHSYSTRAYGAALCVVHQKAEK